MLRRSVMFVTVLALAGCQSGGMSWPSLGWNRTPPYSRSSTTPPANAYAGPQLPSSQATPQPVQGGPYAQNAAAPTSGTYPQGTYGRPYPSQPASFDASGAYGQGVAPPYSPPGTSPYDASSLGPQQGYYDSTYTPTGPAGSRQPTYPLQQGSASQQDWASQQPASGRFSPPAAGPNQASGAALPGEDAYAGAYAPAAGTRVADARATSAPTTSRYDMGSRYNTGPTFGNAAGATMSAATAHAHGANESPAMAGTASSRGGNAWDDASNPATATNTRPRRGTAWDDSPTAAPSAASSASAWSGASGVDESSAPFSSDRAGADSAQAQAGTLEEPWQPGGTGYEPGNNGYQPPNTSTYRSPATAYQPPGTAQDPHYRPGGTGDYEPSSVAGRRATTARRPTRISPAELGQDVNRPASPPAGYPRTSAADR